ncbi:putative transporter/permease protein [Besnoitia besnoiti]|uniref:Putative transporter/permease protein n=1 Tax=Besnoitia besnoiti TaxID=94643 RepID=A0A2A9MKG4_BESBE|nr:putative transporter/permease protein [Besnoitia besnoiti]PFH36771.1 putative transporter/permease protein [Besnoitia besnoiti]
MGQAAGTFGGFLTRQHVIQAATVLLFLAAYCVQPLLVDIIKHNGGAHSSTFSILLPHYYSMIMVGTLPTKQKLSECDWRKGMLVSSLDIVNQLLKKAGLLYAGAAVYIVVDSSSMVWTAVWSVLLLRRKLELIQWIAISLITLGISLKACQLNFTFRDEEFFGVILILLASVLMGLTFVLNEKFMRGDKKIEGPNLVCMMGVCCAIPVTLWTIFWTLPRFTELVVEPILEKSGSYRTVGHCFFWLFVSGWMHSGTLWYLMTHFGAVSTGILKGLKVALVFLISHWLFCDIQPNQCLNVWTGTSALICVVGVVLYSFAPLALPAASKEPSGPLLASKAEVSSIVRLSE